MKRFKSHQAFTLIEVIVSIALIGLIAISIMGLFTSSLFNNRASKSKIESSVSAKDIMENVKNELKLLPEGESIVAKVGEIESLYSGSTIEIKLKDGFDNLYIIEVEVEEAREGRVEKIASQIYLP